MKKLIIIIAILIFPIFTEASDTNVQYSLREISKTYADAYLTYPGAIKAWYGNTLSKLGIELSTDLENFIKGRWSFRSAVAGYSIYSKEDALTVSLSPTEFKTIFNMEIEKYFDKNTTNQIKLDIFKRYLAPGE